ncbi:DMT family transporter [Rhodococcus artemisiae]|uniref:Multidrug efflux SMR transporter n=1 Tax=Rhodococcus artemisiae TaxID=714159 RepID=A0ABU7LGU1_9NOCA|nr:multidrug efflux SMR transporter [Rhodococcus artemisiae]MEE2060761.1 multidrug efflux SMR transporter [Rhodococcus artemisiae]
MKWLLLVGAIVCEVAATLSLRAATDNPWWYTLVVIGYVASFVFLARVLRRMPVGVAYGIWGAAGIVLTAVIAALVFAEPLTPMMGVGIACIIAGVVIVELGSHPPADEPCDRGELEASAR